MPPPALIIAGLIIIPLSLALSLTFYTYRTRLAQQRAQHHQWHRTNTPVETELSVIEPRTDPQAVKHGDEGMLSTKFTPTRMFPVPYWGPRDEWGPKGVPGGSVRGDGGVVGQGSSAKKVEETGGGSRHDGEREGGERGSDGWEDIVL